MLVRGGLLRLALDRVVQVDLTNTPFDRPAEFDPLAYVTHSVATLPRQFTFEVLLKTDLATAQNEIFDVLGVLEPHPEGVLMRGTTDDLGWLARVLSRFSFDFKILAPDQLRDAIRRHAESLLNLIAQR
jgi:predicted DNA-binding transcriptional regulator YafY